MPQSQLQLQIHHPIESLGIVRAARGDIRAEELQQRLTPKVPFPHKHDFYQIVIIEKGRGWHQIDFEKFDVINGQCYIIQPGQVHDWNLDPDTRGSVLEFTLESISDGKTWSHEDLTGLRQLPTVIQLKDKANQLYDTCLRMKQEFTTQEYGFQVVLQSHLRLFLMHLIRKSMGQKKAHPESVSMVESFRQIIDENFQKHHSVEFYSRSLGLSPKALTMRISRLTGKSARHLIQERILVEAKRLLMYSKTNVKEIGYELGFEDPNYFVRFFREQVGITPLKFRQAQSKR